MGVVVSPVGVVIAIRVRARTRGRTRVRRKLPCDVKDTVFSAALEEIEESFRHV